MLLAKIEYKKIPQMQMFGPEDLKILLSAQAAYGHHHVHMKDKLNVIIQILLIPTPLTTIRHAQFGWRVLAGTM
jgi:hypothetical protein